MIPSAAPRLAVVLPVLDEEPVIARVLAALAESLRAPRLGALDVVLVDDASGDRSVEEALAAWRRLDWGGAPARLHVVSRRVRGGHQRALAEGFRRARAAGADLIFAMDADGQDDPAALPAMIGLLAERDVVFAERAGRSEPAWWRAGYALYRLLLRLALGADLPFGNYCGFRAAVADDLLAGPPFRHLAATLASGPYRVGRVKVARRPRLGGAAKMTPLALVDYGIAALAAGLRAERRVWSAPRGPVVEAEP